MKPSLGLALLLSLLATSSPARAETPAASAEALIEQGLDLREKGDDLRALALFERAHAQSPSPRSLAQIALAEQALGRWAEAERHLGEALRGPANPFITRNKAALESALATISERLGTLEVTGGVPGAEVSVNGQPQGTLPLPGPLRVPAGSAALEVRASGHLPVVRNVMVPARGHTREFVHLVGSVAPVFPAPAAGASALRVPAEDPRAAPAGRPTSEAAPSAASSPGGWRRVGIRAGVALAALSLGVGVTGHILRESYAGRWNDRGCEYDDSGEPADYNGCPGVHDAGKTAETVMIAGYAGAGVFGLGALTLWLTAPASETGPAVAFVPTRGGALVLGAARF